jgi:hypothetical protein
MGKFNLFLGNMEHPYIVNFSRKLGTEELNGETVSYIKHDFIEKVDFESYIKGPKIPTCAYTYQKISSLNVEVFSIYFYASKEIDLHALCLNEGRGSYKNVRGDFDIHVVKITDKIYPDQEFTHPEEIAQDLIFWYDEIDKELSRTG